MPRDSQDFGRSVCVPTDWRQRPPLEACIKKAVVCVPNLYSPSILIELSAIQRDPGNPRQDIGGKRTAFLNHCLAYMKVRGASRPTDRIGRLTKLDTLNSRWITHMMLGASRKQYQVQKPYQHSPHGLLQQKLQFSPKCIVDSPAEPPYLCSAPGRTPTNVFNFGAHHGKKSRKGSCHHSS